MTRRTLTGALALLGLALVVPFQAEAAARLESRLEIAGATLQTGDEAVVQFALSNSGDRAARVLRWHTPLFGVDDDLFEVTRNGEAVTYLGRLFKRSAPQASDYLTLRPGQVLTAAVPLNSLYDMSRPGEYTVRYRVELANPFARGAGDAEALTSSNTLVLWLDGDDLSSFAKAVEPEDAPSPDALTPSFRNCSTTRQSSALHRAQLGPDLLDRRALVPQRRHGRAALHDLVRQLHQLRATRPCAPTSRRSTAPSAPRPSPSTAAAPTAPTPTSTRAALHRVPVQRLLERAQHGHRLQGGHAGPRDLALHRGGRHRRPGLRPDRRARAWRPATPRRPSTTPTATSTSPRTPRRRTDGTGRRPIGGAPPRSPPSAAASARP